jgi:hypothetical protein
MQFSSVQCHKYHVLGKFTFYQKMCGTDVQVWFFVQLGQLAALCTNFGFMYKWSIL